MATRRAKKKPSKIRTVSASILTPEMRLAVGMGQLVLDYIVTKVLPEAKASKGSKDIATLRRRIEKAAAKAIGMELKTKKRK